MNLNGLSLQSHGWAHGRNGDEVMAQEVVARVQGIRPMSLRRLRASSLHHPSLFNVAPIAQFIAQR
jgi:hypothetical protein